jgi:GNAT acetyltransferase-like protein/acetyltransferase (GNAT) family protein
LPDDDYVVRPMTRPEFDMALDWAAAEGWNPGLYDADAYYATDPEGFHVGLLDGEAVGCIAAVKYSPDYAFLGVFIVKRELRGGRFGPPLAAHAAEHVGSAMAGLDGVLEQANRYAHIWGFQDAYHNLRFQGLSRPAGDAEAHISAYTAADLAAVERYDRACFPAPRRAFLERWLQQPEAHALLYADADAGSGDLGGYGMIRRARDGYRIGPLFADDPHKADALFDALVSRVPAGTPVYMDVPQPNTAAMNLVTRRDMKPMFETARMYRGGAPDIDLEKVFGVTTLELG